MSPPEVRVWAMLRRPPFREHHFRRQVQLGPFYADFASHAARLVIEVDGASHFHEDEMSYDNRRSEFIAREGYTIVRLTTSEAMNNLDAAADAILARLPPPVPAAPSHPPHKSPRPGAHKRYPGGDGGAHLKEPKAR